VDVTKQRKMVVSIAYKPNATYIFDTHKMQHDADVSYNDLPSIQELKCASAHGKPEMCRSFAPMCESINNMCLAGPFVLTNEDLLNSATDRTPALLEARRGRKAQIYHTRRYVNMPQIMFHKCQAARSQEACENIPRNLCTFDERFNVCLVNGDVWASNDELLRTNFGVDNFGPPLTDIGNVGLLTNL
jgi:hypothetical protein